MSISSQNGLKFLVKFYCETEVSSKSNIKKQAL